MRRALRAGMAATARGGTHRACAMEVRTRVMGTRRGAGGRGQGERREDGRWAIGHGHDRMRSMETLAPVRRHDCTVRVWTP